jgi:hypothetical protein
LIDFTNDGSNDSVKYEGLYWPTPRDMLNGLSYYSIAFRVTRRRTGSSWNLLFGECNYHTYGPQGWLVYIDSSNNLRVMHSTVSTTDWSAAPGVTLTIDTAYDLVIDFL